MAEGVIERILVTGDDDALDRFWLAAMLIVNGIDRRGQTCFYTVVPGTLREVLDAARATRVTVQRRRPDADIPPSAPPEAYWEVIHQGDAPAWSAAADEQKGDADAAR